MSKESVYCVNAGTWHLDSLDTQMCDKLKEKLTWPPDLTVRKVLLIYYAVRVIYWHCKSNCKSVQSSPSPLYFGETLRGCWLTACILKQHASYSMAFLSRALNQLNTYGRFWTDSSIIYHQNPKWRDIFWNYSVWRVFSFNLSPMIIQYVLCIVICFIISIYINMREWQREVTVLTLHSLCRTSRPSCLLTPDWMKQNGDSHWELQFSSGSMIGTSPSTITKTSC